MLSSVLVIPQIKTNVIIQLYENINDIITWPDDNAKITHNVVILAEANRMLSPGQMIMSMLVASPMLTAT
jgi:hypothetical protein